MNVNLPILLSSATHLALFKICSSSSKVDLSNKVKVPPKKTQTHYTKASITFKAKQATIFKNAFAYNRLILKNKNHNPSLSA